MYKELQEEAKQFLDLQIIKEGDKLLCIKDLYKSTYKSNAFDKGKQYTITLIDEYYWISDNKGNNFSFTVLFKWGICELFEYFKII